MRENDGPPPPTTLAELAARLTPILPEHWRHGVTAALVSDTLVMSFDDAEGRHHALSMRRMRPEMPTLVPSARVAFAHEPVDAALDESALFEPYRDALTSLAAHEDDILACIPGVVDLPPPATPSADPVALADSYLSVDESVDEAVDEGPEWLAFEAGLKAAIRVVLPQHANLAALEQRVHARSWGFFAPEHALEFTGGDQHLAYVARDDAAARALADAERASMCDDREERARRNAHVGRLLGYPGCCADAFAERMRRGVTTCLDGTTAHEDYAAAEAAARASGTFLGRLNNLLPDRAHPRLITWYPCRYDCPASAEFAAALMGVLRDRTPDLAAAWSRALVTRCGVDRSGRHLAEGEHSDDDPLWLEFPTF